MRARLPFILAFLMLALASCGDDNSGGGGGGGDRQSTVSAEAYPTVAKFLDSTADVYTVMDGPICEELAAKSDKDTVAAVAEDTCKDLRTLIRDAGNRNPDIAKTCKGDNDCLADKGGPLVRKFVEEFRELATTYNSSLGDALTPGPCLRALKLPESHIEDLDATLERLPEALRRLRAGDKSVVQELFDDDKADFSKLDPGPCRA